jgi:hypothetical protein
MSQNISGFGLRIVITASNTYPAGFTVSQLADDTDVFDLPEITIAETAMGVNGDMVIWAKAVPIDLKIAVIPNGPDDINLSILLEANRVAKGKTGARDIITVAGVYPDGSIKTLVGGAIISGVPGNGVSAAGRFKTKVYGFRFENQAGVTV